MPWTSRRLVGVASRRRLASGAAVLLAVVMAVGVVVTSAASAVAQTAIDCTGDVGDPVGPSVEWDQADLNNQQCAVAGLHMIQDNPAVAAATAANAAAGAGDFGGDPFRAPHRWAGERGSYQPTSYQDRDGNSWPAALFGPLDLGAGPYPGVLLACHVCDPRIPQTQHIWYWAAEALAESGYVVLYATVGGNSASRGIDATDFFVATPSTPTPRGDFNPWYASLDRTRLGIVGHSGAAGVAITVGHTDARYDAIVAWDPAGSYTMAGVTPRVPTMIQVADYRQESVPPARHEKPIPALPKFGFFDTIRAAGVDAMQVGLRASMHFEWSRFPSDASRPHSIYGEIVGTYYTLAWLDRHLAPSRVPGAPPPHAGASPSAPGLSNAVAIDALRRLTASGTDRFDRSADVHSIGVGFYDAKQADKAGNTEAGNVPVTIAGLPIRNLLSFQYDSKYFLDGGALQCADMRAGCPRQ
jgi:hypothetical protein